MNAVALMPVAPLTVTDITPVVAPAGTVVVILVAELAVTTAAMPLNVTILLAGDELKFAPVMVTVVPMGPLVGVKEVIDGLPTRFSYTTNNPAARVRIISGLPSEFKSPVVIPRGAVTVVLKGAAKEAAVNAPLV